MINTEVYMEFASVPHLKYSGNTRDTHVKCTGNTPKKHQKYTNYTLAIYRISVLPAYTSSTPSIPSIFRIIHEYQSKTHVMHENSIHHNVEMIEKSR